MQSPSTFGLVGVVAGASLTGVTRGQTVPLLLTVVLVSLSTGTSERRRQMAAGVGMAVGAGFLIIYRYRVEAMPMLGPRRLDPRRLALGIVEFQPTAVLAILGAGLLLGLGDVLAYREASPAKSHAALDEMTRDAEDLGLYD